MDKGVPFERVPAHSICSCFSECILCVFVTLTCNGSEGMCSRWGGLSAWCCCPPLLSCSYIASRSTWDKLRKRRIMDRFSQSVRFSGDGSSFQRSSSQSQPCRRTRRQHVRCEKKQLKDISWFMSCFLGFKSLGLVRSLLCSPKLHLLD